MSSRVTVLRVTDDFYLYKNIKSDFDGADFELRKGSTVLCLGDVADDLSLYLFDGIVCIDLKSLMGTYDVFKPIA